jgi:CBS domain-containing protein
MVQVMEIMKTDVQTTDPGESVYQAAGRMSIHKVSCLVVTEDSRIVGIITQRDISNRVVAENKDAQSTTVADVMTKDVMTIDEKEELKTAAELMKVGGIKQLPVLSMGDLAGIITLTDLSKFEL